ncbi:MAG: hypothetical protein S0880_04725 [Actinomycetota bacterium]|nr:hypothetical protein [Actinomycetota bacterium]
MTERPSATQVLLDLDLDDTRLDERTRERGQRWIEKIRHQLEETEPQPTLSGGGARTLSSVG